MNLIKWIKPLFLIFIFFTFFFSNVFAQENSTDSSPNVVHPVHPSVVIIIGVLCTMFCLSFLILACMKFCNSDFTLQAPHVIPIARSRSRSTGIDKKAIESLPFFRFSSLKGSKEGLECVVCLSKFEDTELLRLLPKCRHAFHMKCIDQWLESHSTCPLCRYKFDLSDVKNFTFTNSLRYAPDDGLNNLEIFVKREQDGSSRSSSSRWSDVNSSDLMFLNSNMLNEASSKHFSPSSSGRFEVDIEQVMKFKEDMERRRLHECKIGKTIDSGESSVSTSQFPRFVKGEESEGIEKRSMSEITNVSRFRETRSSYWASGGKEDELQRVWLPMAKRTIEWFTNGERNQFESRT
ncbi:hypothetical protein L1987_00117 [Smallanthus sonchifolius]|uniref:Uncharacterized protein n=1 Tax=Smallanthus sonchifolius TaxID=185202 RepID=A0ACB9K1H9_9ASTR|nr:hypothetical protein L1987_00117 [Smallanthus sonchifolius]